MMIDDYYGFNRNRNQSGSMPGGRSSSRTQRSAHALLNNRKSPNTRTLKRTELSNEKIYSRDSKKAKKLQPPHLARQETSREPQSVAARTLHSQDYSQPQPYPNEHLNTDSYQFRDSEHPRQFQNPFSSQRRGAVGTRAYEQTPSRPHHQANPRNYRSASRDRNQSFLFNFEREPQPIERYQRQAASNHDIRAKKSRSLGRLKPYKMHTFYHAEKMKYCHYQEGGYITQRQQQLLIKIQDRALMAFQRAVADSSVKSRPQKQNKQKPKKQFQIQESSKIQHRHSGILSDLKRQSSYRGTPRSSQRQLSKQHKKKSQKVLQLSINPKKTIQNDPKYDDYQISVVSKNKNEQPSKKSQEEPKKDIFKHFAKDDSDDSSSLLEFKPKPKPKQQVKPVPVQREQSVKRSSQISNDYKSVDMMEINSNYKPNKLEIKERNDFIVDQNRSLGMDTIRSNKPKLIVPIPQKQKQVRDFSDSSSESQSQQFSGLSSESKSKDQSQHSKQESSKKIDMSKNKPKKSMSLSEPYSISSQNENIKKVEKKVSDKQIDFKKKINPLTQSDRFLSSRESIDLANSSNTSIKKPIKRLTKKANKPLQVQEHKFEDDLDVLGMQSYNNADTFTIQIRPYEKKNSKISQLSSRNEVQQSSNSINKPNEKIPSVSRQDLSPSSLKDAPSIKKQPSNHSRSQPSIAYKSKHRLSSQVNSNAQYELFLQIRDFLEMEEFDYIQTRRAKQVQNLISQELQGVIGKIEDHLYIINCMAQIVLLIPDIYDFQIIYDRSNTWVFFQVFLTLKKFLFERGRVVQALKGGKNCFKLLNYIIQDQLLKKYLPRVEIQNILSDLQQCNFKLQELINHFYSFLINFNQKQFGNNPLINLKPFRMNEDLQILLTEYKQEVQVVLKKKEQQFKGGNVSTEESQEFEMMLLLNERVFRLMQISFVLSNLAGRQIKAYEKDEELFKQESKFKNYLFENYDQFKEIPKYFK